MLSHEIRTGAMGILLWLKFYEYVAEIFISKFGLMTFGRGLRKVQAAATGRGQGTAGPWFWWKHRSEVKFNFSLFSRNHLELLFFSTLFQFRFIRSGGNEFRFGLIDSFSPYPLLPFPPTPLFLSTCPIFPLDISVLSSNSVVTSPSAPLPRF